MTEEIKRDNRAAGYIQAFETLRYGQSCHSIGDRAGELFALKHAAELANALLIIAETTERSDWEGDDEHAVELDGVREVPGAVPDIQEAPAPEEEGAREAHVVPVVQGSDEAPGEVLTGQPTDASRHGLSGINPKRGIPPRRFRLYRLDDEGNIAETVDEGTASEIANRNSIGPSTVYRLAGKPARKGNLWHVEKVAGTPDERKEANE